MTNFHTHTSRCQHAIGSPIDYINEINKSGENFSQLGFSDHCPYPDDPRNVWLGIRMSCKEIPQYLEDIKKAKNEAPFEVFSGFECEWDREFEGWFKDILLKEYKVDYLIYGPHWVKKNNNFIYALEIDDTKLFYKYIDTVIEGIHSKLFKIIAHPDLVLATWKEWTPTIESSMKEIILAAKEENIPLEINGLGTKRPLNITTRGPRYQYPVEEFWKLAKEMNATVICSADSHNPNQTIPNTIAALNFAKELNIEPIKSIF